LTGGIEPSLHNLKDLILHLINRQTGGINFNGIVRLDQRRVQPTAIEPIPFFYVANGLSQVNLFTFCD
jgi:hypothetical protein